MCTVQCALCTCTQHISQCATRSLSDVHIFCKAFCTLTHTVVGRRFAYIYRERGDTKPIFTVQAKTEQVSRGRRNGLACILVLSEHEFYSVRFLKSSSEQAFPGGFRQVKLFQLLSSVKKGKRHDALLSYLTCSLNFYEIPCQIDFNLRLNFSKTHKHNLNNLFMLCF